MWMFAGLAALTAGATGGAADVEALQRLWPGVRDSNEQMVVNTERGAVGWTEGVEHRVRTLVAPIELPWLGKHVLYLEEFFQDEPDELRRQVVLQLEAQGPPEAAVRVHLYTLLDPARWVHLDRRARLAQKLRKEDLLAASGCDLVMVRDGEPFRGGTVGHDCRVAQERTDRYVDYQLVIGADLYWYRRRVMRANDDRVTEEVMGFNWFELNESQLFTCRIDWSASGTAADRKPLLRLDVINEGGRGRFSTPDGRVFELSLHSQDWPFSGERAALILILRAEGSAAPIGSAWSSAESQQISLDAGAMRVRCGSVAPESDELSAALSPPGWQYRAAGRG